MTTDPYPQYSPQELGPPYENAFNVDLAALATGDTIELPCVSTELMISGQAGKASLLMFTLKSGQEMAFGLAAGTGSVRVPVRATQIKKVPVEDIDGDPSSYALPLAIVALW
ncbi:MAG: hypothetical protein JSR78_06510 [Proteobacteria bacterium]|nr:hypothetical protein [Pseudomonadota bacterium]